MPSGSKPTPAGSGVGSTVGHKGTRETGGLGDKSTWGGPLRPAALQGTPASGAVLSGGEGERKSRAKA